jgi:hypothetical protein
MRLIGNADLAHDVRDGPQKFADEIHRRAAHAAELTIGGDSGLASGDIDVYARSWRRSSRLERDLQPVDRLDVARARGPVAPDTDRHDVLEPRV